MIIVAGEALVDLVIDPTGVVVAALGGAPFNTARTCGRLDADVAFVGSISNDRFGSLLAARLAADDVSIDRVVRTDAPTTLAAAELNDHGAATYRFYIDGTSAPALDAPPSDLDCDAFFMGGLGLVLEPMARTLESILGRFGAAGDHLPLVMIDVNCRPLIVPDREAYVDRARRTLSAAHVVKVSDEDLDYLVPGASHLDAARELLAWGPRAVLLTAGRDGVHVVTADGEESVPVEPVDVVDTIGAGDSFAGAFLTWWTMADRSPADSGRLDHLVPAVRAANTIAGIVCTRRGADPPRLAELPADWAP